MLFPMVFFLQNAKFMLDKNDRIVERYNTPVIRIHFDTNANINLFTVTCLNIQSGPIKPRVRVS
jgi:hypothetical protein